MRGNASRFAEQQRRTKADILGDFRCWLHMAREEKVLTTSVPDAYRMFSGADPRIVECELLAKQAAFRRRAGEVNA